MKKGFFAYSSHPQIISETIGDAIVKLNESGLFLIKSWKELKINGRYIINQVVREIENSDFFCADLTGLNDNVLFEIGYAIGINKPIILFNDTTQVESFRRYKAGLIYYNWLFSLY
ncbi:nucleoside 2-deoxyribosyltransferase [Leptospira santarosai]|uniref:nucleoside 2-deoxyribosyltransferase n=1 Tax=Leptospira santarosai TaxID=28183 RepID=UPI00037D2DD9|nr:nucleoside 2-deoxyribosyltransferase [Leptospira santarosai]